MFKCYKMDSDPRGVVLIINNSKFEKDYGERQGTEHDCRKLKELFEGFKFKVFVKENLRAIVSMFFLCQKNFIQQKDFHPAKYKNFILQHQYTGMHSFKNIFL